MPAETLNRPTETQPNQSPDLSLQILREARYALPWNEPATAEAALARNQARVQRFAKEARFGSPYQRAESRYLRAKSIEDTRRVRQAGLASGSTEENATGMVFAVPVQKEKPEGEPTSIGDRDTQFELWYMSHKDIDRALDLSYTDQASNRPQVDMYVFRAALGFVTSRDGSPEGQIKRFDLHPLDAKNIMSIARYMKNNNRHGRIPSRLEIISEDILHSGQFPQDNVVNFSATHQALDQRARTA